jgi:hypothetical protein
MDWTGNFKPGNEPDSAVQATDAHFFDGTVTDRYNRTTKSIVEVASAIGGCTSARPIAAAPAAEIKNPAHLLPCQPEHTAEVVKVIEVLKQAFHIACYLTMVRKGPALSASPFTASASCSAASFDSLA